MTCVRNTHDQGPSRLWDSWIVYWYHFRLCIATHFFPLFTFYGVCVYICVCCSTHGFWRVISGIVLHCSSTLSFEAVMPRAQWYTSQVALMMPSSLPSETVQVANTPSQLDMCQFLLEWYVLLNCKPNYNSSFRNDRLLFWCLH